MTKKGNRIKKQIVFTSVSTESKIKERKIDMKNYQKPILDIREVAVKENLSTLNDWLNGNGGTYTNAGITTYVIES